MSTQSIRLATRTDRTAELEITFHWDTAAFNYAPETKFSLQPGSVIHTIGPISSDVLSPSAGNPLVFNGRTGSELSACRLFDLQSNSRYDVSTRIYYGTGTDVSTFQLGGTAVANANFLTYPARPTNLALTYSTANRTFTITWDQPQGGGADTIYAQVRVYTLNGGSLPPDFPDSYRGYPEIATTASGNSLTGRFYLGETVRIYVVPINAAGRYDLQNRLVSTENYLELVGAFVNFQAPHIWPWYWTISNGTATAAQTQAAYAAITGGGKVSDFSYLVWNDMVKKLAAALAFKEMTWFGTKPTMTSTDRTLTAARWNNFTANLARAQGSTASSVSASDPVYGSYIINAMNDLNTNVISPLYD